MIHTPHKPFASHALRSPSSRVRRTMWLLLLMVMGTAVADLQGATITLVDEQLNLMPIRLQSMDEQTVSYFDAKGNYQTRPTADFLQLRVTLDAKELKQLQADAAVLPTPMPSASPAVAPAPTPPVTPSPTTTPASPPADQPVAATQPQSGVPALEGWGIVDLIDGQRLIGKFVSSDDKGQLMQWEHPLAGRLTFKLDSVHQWRFMNLTNQSMSTITPVTDGQDRLYLSNGDALSGFVSAVSDKGITFTPQGSKQAVDIAMSRVQAMVLANAPRPQTATASLVTLADGSRLRGTHVVIEQGRLRFDPQQGEPGRSISLGLLQLRRLDIANERWQLVSWMDLPRQIKPGDTVFTTPWPVREQDGDLYLHAPATVMFTLPANAKAVAAEVSLDVSHDDPGLHWADFVVTVQLSGDGGSVELARQALNAQHQQGRLRAKLGGDVAAGSASASRRGATTLTLKLDPALNGPIMDRLKLADAWVVVARQK